MPEDPADGRYCCLYSDTGENAEISEQRILNMKKTSLILTALLFAAAQIYSMTLTLNEIRSVDSAHGADIGFRIGPAELYFGLSFYQNELFVADTTSLLTEFDAFYTVSAFSINPTAGLRLYAGKKAVQPYINCGYSAVLPDLNFSAETSRVKENSEGTEESENTQESEEQTSAEDQIESISIDIDAYMGDDFAVHKVKLGIGAAYSVNDFFGISSEFGNQFTFLGMEPRLPDDFFNEDTDFINFSSLSAKPYSSLSLVFTF